jgi:hypothetical protein
MRIDFSDLGNICTHICQKANYQTIGGTQQWVSSIEGFAVRISFGNRQDRWMLALDDVAIAFTLDVVVTPEGNPAERGLVRFGVTWGEARDCVYWGDPTKVQATLVMMKMLTPNASANEHTYADFAEARDHPNVE